MNETPAFPWLEPQPDSNDTVRLRNVFLHVTKACNLRCDYCYFSASRPLPDELTAEELAAVWPDLVTVSPEKVVFTGGEPLLRADILDLLRGLRSADPEHRVLRCLNSNGQLVTPELARELVGLADEVRVSLDALPERNDALRGAGSFAAALQALDTYYRVGFEPKVLVTVTAHSLPELEELLVLLIERKLTRINLNAFRPIGRGRGHPEWSAPPAQIRAAIGRAWARCYPDRPPPPDPPQETTATNCGVGSFLNVMPNGDVFPCHVLTQSEFRCGNLREQRLVEICRRTGLLGQPQALDFQQVAVEHPALSGLAQPRTCMGEVYAESRAQAAWHDTVPALPLVASRRLPVR